MNPIMNKLEIDKLSYYSHSREEMLEFIPPKTTRLLDISCGAGLFGSQVKKHLSDKVEVWGIEPIKLAADEATKNLDYVLCDTIENSLEKLPDNFFDCITFNDVLEHLVYPEIVLSKVSRKLAPEGIIVASIPNVRYFLVVIDLMLYRDWEYQEWGVLDKTHLRFFTEKSISILFYLSGYKIISKKGINSLPLAYKKHNMILSACSFLFPQYFDDMKYMNFAISAILK
ncbi:MAG: class I SAM-dependent methyltransferase [Dolichospermum sp.]